MFKYFNKIVLEGNMKFRFLLNIILIMFLVFFVSFDCGKKLTDKELVELAQNEGSRGNSAKAIELYEELLRIHPSSEFGPMALFMIGYLNANEIKDYEKAKKVYAEFLERYPNDELASSVKFELQNMGKSPEELIR